MPIRLLVVCADSAWGETIRSEFGCGCTVGSWGRGAAPIECARTSSRADVVLLEFPRDPRPMREQFAVAAAAADCGVLLACEAGNRELVVEALESGVRGCLLKSSPVPVLRQALGAVLRGETWYSTVVLLEALRSGHATPQQHPGEEGRLTSREDQILHLIGSGLTNKEIGRRLAISEQTVKTHLHHVYVKLNRSGRYKAFLAQPGWLAPDTRFLGTQVRDG